MMTRALEAAGAKKIFILGRRENVLQEAARGSVCACGCVESDIKKDRGASECHILMLQAVKNRPNSL